MGNKDGSRGRRRRWLVLGVVFVAGFAVAGVVWRRKVKALFDRAVPYVRQRARSANPALIINRWSGDGKAERLGLADAAQRAGITTIMLERGDDLAQLAHDAISAGADAIGMAGGTVPSALWRESLWSGWSLLLCAGGARNHFALDLGLDRDDPLAALDAFPDGERQLGHPCC